MEATITSETRRYPQIYATFEGKSKNGALPRKYWIQDAPEVFYDAIVEHLKHDFCREEPICKYMNGYSDKVSSDEAGAFTSELLKKRTSLVCLTKDKQGEIQLAALNALSVDTCADEEEDYKSDGWFLPFMMDLFDYIDKQKSVYKELGVDRVLKDIGLYVLPEYRGEGIATEIFRARIPLCKSLGVKATSTIFTSHLSQKAAYKAGYKDFYSIDYEELAKINSKFYIPGIKEHTKSIKVLYKNVE